MTQTMEWWIYSREKEKKEVPGRTLKKLKSGEEIDQFILRHRQ